MRNPQLMRTWGDVALALNLMVRAGQIAGFRTNRHDKLADPEIEVRPAPRQSDAAAIELVRATLSGKFVAALVSAISE